MSYNDYVDDYSPTQTKAVDKFGYYNGRTGNTDLVERQLVEFGMPYDGDRGVCRHLWKVRTVHRTFYSPRFIRCSLLNIRQVQERN